ncbi:hypothetical protein BGZ96_003323 [Linnemannia gamsii]|uniref:GDP-fucose pyrophosphorylase domain-containing protein n=1 Tax=Linnemannia gamsii TaxID=64522 RepID=A0ABQ7K7U5_9FUNG|nr:hypothetical protein BGZ96_003323 [Linnemannia gamsii]
MASLGNTSEAVAASVDELSNVLRDVHAENLAAYSRLLEDELSTRIPITSESNEPVATVDNEPPFWDIVVITAGDEQQKHCYQQRIDQKLAERSIPTRARYLVIEDPPYSKIGSGGSTCLVMKVLQGKFPADFLLEARTLLIHAGGYSTRLPHVSARGKVFTTLPQADKPEGIQVLDLKLVLYLHLLRSMPPGVFLTSADGIELFSSSSPFPKEPKPFTITALAHPSSLKIGSTHGVYLLEDLENLISADRARNPKDQAALLLKCRKFLHKPSLDKMHKTPELIYNNKSLAGEEVVYTDSCYYFDPHTATLMANVYQHLSLKCDLEAWADVLSFQDSSSSPFTLEAGSDQGITQQPLKQALRDANVQLDVMVLNSSKFYHLGTMQEFIAATCTDRAFMSELNIRNSTPGVAIISSPGPSAASQQQGLDQNQGTPRWQTEYPLFIENCHIPPTAQIGAGSVLVDTNLLNTEEEGNEKVLIPENTCMFTLQLREHAYVTFTFSVNDDMKRAISTSTITTTSSSSSAAAVAATEEEETNNKERTSPDLLQRLKIFETVPVNEMLTNNDQQQHQHRPPTSQIQACGNNLSLWTAPVFEIALTAEDSTRFALVRLARIRQFQTGRENTTTTTTTTLSRPTATMMGWVSLKDAARLAREL